MVYPVKMISFPPVFDQNFYTYNVVLPYSKENKPDQKFGNRLVAQIVLQSQLFDDPAKPGATVEKRLLHVDLANSSVDAPANCLQENWCRGWFVESVHYSMWLQAPVAMPSALAGVINPAPPVSTWSIMMEAPNTSNQTGTISSSISYGFNVSTGMFGDIGTVNAGGNIGVTNTHSITLTDFTFVQHSDAQTLDHRVNMTLCGDGSAYTEVDDLVDAWQSPFVGLRLRPITPMASSNVPIGGQAVWMNNSPAGLVDDLVLAIQVTGTFALIDGENAPPLKAQHAKKSVLWQKFVNLDMRKIKQS